MEFQIRNSYIKKFLKGFSAQNEIKVLKYLTIVGIHHLETNKTYNISFADLKKLTKNITKDYSKDEKLINKELLIIKNELAKLNQRFEGKSTDESESPKQKNMNETFPRNAVESSKTQDKRTLAKKPPASTTRKGFQPQKKQDGEKNTQSHKFQGRRSSSVEPAARHRGLNDSNDITLKPNEVTLPPVDPNDNKNFITKHHLDDTEAKAVMKEEGIVYFPGREKSPDNVPNQKGKTKQSSPIRTFPQGNATHERLLAQTYSAAKRANSQYEQDLREMSKSPDFVQPRYEETASRVEGPPARKQQVERDVEDSRHERASKGHKKRASIQRGNSKHRSHKSKKSITNSKILHQKPSRDRVYEQINRTQLNQTQFEKGSGNEYSDEMDDETRYQREMSRQYPRTAQSYQYPQRGDGYNQQYTDEYSEEASENSSEQTDFRRVNRTKGTAYHPSVDQSSDQYYSSPHHMNHKLLESTSSPQKSMYTKNSPVRYSEKSSGYGPQSGGRSGRSGDREGHRFSHKGESAVKNSAGILDIANSFLNSTIMARLNNYDEKGSKRSPGSSHNTSNSEQSDFMERHTRQTMDEERRTLADQVRSPKKRAHKADRHGKTQNRTQHNHHQSNFSDWVGVYKTDKQGGKENNSSILNDLGSVNGNTNGHSRVYGHGNKRYAERPSKESASMENKNDVTDFSSSDFSNFLNDDMKGFFQKETLEMKKPTEYSKSIMKSNAESFQTSFNANDGHKNYKGDYYHKKNSHAPSHVVPRHHGNKSYIRDSVDAANVFLQDRMNATQFSSTSGR